MPPGRRRTKKLILALHYFTGNAAAWKCEDCRRQGLEERRRCGWRGGDGRRGRVIWASHGSVTEECPKTAIRPESVAWLELWATWRRCGKGIPAQWSAKDLDAMAVLEAEWERMQDEARRLRD